MEFDEVVRRRRMVRAFAPDPVDPQVVDDLLDRARRSPTAGNSQAIEFLVLEGPEQTGKYWDTTLPLDRRADFGWPDLLVAPVIIVIWVDPAATVGPSRRCVVHGRPQSLIPDGQNK